MPHPSQVHLYNFPFSWKSSSLRPQASRQHSSSSRSDSGLFPFLWLPQQALSASCEYGESPDSVWGACQASPFWVCLIHHCPAPSVRSTHWSHWAVTLREQSLHRVNWVLLLSFSRPRSHFGVRLSSSTDEKFTCRTTKKQAESAQRKINSYSCYERLHTSICLSTCF